MRDVIILSMIKNGIKSGQGIEKGLGIQRSITKRSLSFLNSSGLIRRHGTYSNDYYDITEAGRKIVDGVFRR